MPRPPKKQDAPAVAPIVPAVPVIDANNFKVVRDSISQQLDIIQNMVTNLNADFKRQTNLLLGVGELDVALPIELPNIAGLAQPFIAPAFAEPAAPAPAPAAEEGKKERKKRVHDPHAPKRPLTPYFLYMQTARPIISNDLGPEAAKGAVQEEGQRRWSSMDASEKAGWDNAYKYNLRLYNARVHSYKNGNPLAKDMSDDDALAYAERNGIPLPVSDSHGGEQEALNQQLQGTSADAPGEEEEPPAKTPKKSAGRKRKSEVEPPKTATPAAPASPDAKKRRRSGKAEEKEEPKKAGRSKKAKSS